MSVLMAFFLLLVVVILLLSPGFFTVKQQTVAIVERFGKFLCIARPGLRFKIPFIDTIAGHLNLRLQQLDVLVETKTRDNVFVKILVSVQYEVMSTKLYEAFYRLNDPAEQILSFVFDVVRANVPGIDLDDVFSKKDDIASSVRDELSGTMADLGYNLVKALVTDIQPNENVKNAMNEINTAKRLRVAAHEKGEAEKIMVVKQAEAHAEANILQGRGIAGQRKAIIDGLGKSVEEIQRNYPQLHGENIMKMILMIQYFDMLKEIGGQSNSNTVFIGHSPDSMNDISRQMMEALFATQSLDRK